MKKFRFVSNQNSTINGINDAGIETFTANIKRSLVRENLQNALDAVIPNSKEPVRVEFSLFNIPADQVPDIATLRDVVDKCISSNHDEPEAVKFFTRAKNILSGSTVPVLRISDFNTVGLGGSDTCSKGTNWSRLVKESGSSNKGTNSGGSFGIGKSAAFACSDLRTVFYSSLDDKGLRSNFGVARLVSFEDPALGWTTGIGYYSEDERFVAIPELANIDPNHSRTSSGTDIYIIGMHDPDDFRDEFVKATLMDFLVSLVRGKLVVQIQDEIIDSNTLAKYMSKLNPYDGDDVKALLDYYHLLTSADPTILRINLESKVYGKKYGFADGECTLILKQGEGYNRKILITRSAGMRIFEQDRISGSIEFTGILLIDGPTMNKTFKAMEVPSHDKWEPGRCRENVKFYTGAFDDLRKYMRTQVKAHFGKASSSAIDAYGASDFLPDRIDEEAEQKLQKNDFSTRIKKLLGKEKAPVKKKVKQVELVAGEEPSGTGKSKTKGGEGTSGSKSGDTLGYKKVDVKKRLACVDSNSSKYKLTFLLPNKAKRGKLQFSIAGEQIDVELPIVSANILSGPSGLSITKISDDNIYLEGIQKGVPVTLEVSIDFDNYCMMEVDYYESKK